MIVQVSIFFCVYQSDNEHRSMTLAALLICIFVSSVFIEHVTIAFGINVKHVLDSKCFHFVSRNIIMGCVNQNPRHRCLGRWQENGRIGKLQKLLSQSILFCFNFSSMLLLVSLTICYIYVSRVTKYLLRLLAGEVFVRFMPITLVCGHYLLLCCLTPLCSALTVFHLLGLSMQSTM